MKYCPECGASLAKYMRPTNASQPQEARSVSYNQDDIWRAIQSEAQKISLPPAAADVADAAVDELGQAEFPLQSVVHVLFDRSVTPSGGVLHQAVLSEGRMKVDGRMLEAHGYVVEDGKIVLHDGVPMGAFCQILQYWAGEKQYRRWHMTEPVTFSASRSSSPFFMDERMVAFGAAWTDGSKMKEALTDLLSLCENFGQKVIGKGVLVRITKQ